MLRYGTYKYLLVFATLLFLFNSCKKEVKDLRVLAWVGYEEEDIVKPFENEFGIQVITETFVGADNMFAKLSKDPGAYDVVVIDPEYIAKLHSAGLLSELNIEDYDFSDYIEPMKDFPLCKIDGKLYAVLVRYGINALVYNTKFLSKEDVKSYSILWNPKVKDKIGVWDWYLPQMGIYSAAQELNKQNPYQLSKNQFQKLSMALDSLKPQIKGVMGTFTDINNALVREDIWIAPGLGEHTAAVLSDQGYPVDWTIPEEGAIMWIETLGIPPLAKNKTDAVKYIQYMQRPEVQAKLTWREAYRSNIPSIKGIELLTKKQQDILKVHNEKEATDLVNSVYVRLLPTDSIGKLNEQEWQKVWQTFKSNN